MPGVGFVVVLVIRWAAALTVGVFDSRRHLLFLRYRVCVVCVSYLRRPSFLWCVSQTFVLCVGCVS